MFGGQARLVDPPRPPPPFAPPRPPFPPPPPLACAPVPAAPPCPPSGAPPLPIVPPCPPELAPVSVGASNPASEPPEPGWAILALLPPQAPSTSKDGRTITENHRRCDMCARLSSLSEGVGKNCGEVREDKARMRPADEARHTRWHRNCFDSACRGQPRTKERNDARSRRSKEWSSIRNVSPSTGPAAVRR